jgi:hypothetical protein
MLAGGLWAGPVHKPSLVPCGKPLVARLKAPTVSHSRGLPKAWVSHKGGTDDVALEQLPDLSNGSPYTASAAAIALGTGVTCKTTYMVTVLLEYARFALVATNRHM